jgi:hypothetical protein
MSAQGTALYVYGLMMTAEAEAGSAQAGMLSPNTGIADAPVTEQPAGPLTALVSALLASPVAPTRRNLVAHHRVLERFFSAVDVLPLPFGTVAPDGDGLTRSIAEHRTAFLDALAEVDGQVELGLKARWKPGVVFAEVVGADTELTRLHERLRSDGETYFERVELGRRVEAALAGRRTIETNAIIAALQPLATRHASLAVTEDDMIFNLVFLVRRGDQAAFDERVQKLASRHAERIEFRFAGPAPACHFAAVPAGWLHAVPALGAA